MKAEFDELRRWVAAHEDLEHKEAIIAGLAVLEMALTDIGRIANAMEKIAEAADGATATDTGRHIRVRTI